MNKQTQLQCKDKYKIINWKEYNESLKQRGSITIWISEEALELWKYTGPKLKGGQKKYSDLAIETSLTIRKVYHLKLRQTEGFVNSLIQIMQVNLEVPDYSTLSRRAGKLNISLGNFKDNGNIDIVVDSTGLKVYGEGEWKVRKHGWNKHRTWRKLHIGIDGVTQEIIAEKLTENNIDDADVIEDVLNVSDNIDSFTGDGAYDKKKVRKILTKKKIKQKIPPQHNAVISKEADYDLQSRDKAIKRIKSIGREKWKQEVGYHRRSLVEVAMFRYKTIIGDKILSRKFVNEKVEVRLGCAILNKMTALGMPVSIKVA